jgi:IclR family acetate operon transcriptional repressor
MAESAPPAYPIASVDNALRLLLLFRERDSIRIAEASTELGVVRSTAHRLLAMLQYHDFVRQNAETKAYEAGPALWDIGTSVVRSTDLLAEVRPTLEEIVEEVGETAHVGLLQGQVLRCVAGVETLRSLRTASQVGMTWPAQATAMGRVLLAELPAERLRSLYGGGALEQGPSHAARSLDELADVLEQVRSQGYAVGRDEIDADITEVAVAQRNGAGLVRCALAVSAPSSRLGGKRVPGIAAALAKKAELLAPSLA